MPITPVTIFEIQTKKDQKDIYEIFSNINIKNETINNNELNYYVIESEQKNDMIWIKLHNEDEEGPFYLNGEPQYVKVSYETQILIIDIKYLFLFENRTKSNKIANIINKNYLNIALSKIIFNEEFINKFLKENPHQIKQAIFKNLKVPGIERSRIHGADIETIAEYKNFQDIGEKAYIVLTLTEKNITIGISRNGQISFYSKIEMKEIINFIKNYIVTLLD